MTPGRRIRSPETDWNAIVRVLVIWAMGSKFRANLGAEHRTRARRYWGPSRGARCRWYAIMRCKRVPLMTPACRPLSLSGPCWGLRPFTLQTGCVRRYVLRCSPPIPWIKNGSLVAYQTWWRSSWLGNPIKPLLPTCVDHCTTQSAKR